MRKILLTSALPLLFLSCDKDGNTYNQQYGVVYFKHADSFVARASFCKIPFGNTPSAALDRKESVTFNGQSTSKVEGNVYVWSGKGAPDATFLLKLKKKEYANSMSAGTLGKCRSNTPDTISISTGFTMKVTDYDPQNQGAFTIYDGTGNALGLQIAGDSIVARPEDLQHFSPGRKTITFYESRHARAQNVDPEMGGEITYFVEDERTVVFIQ